MIVPVRQTGHPLNVLESAQQHGVIFVFLCYRAALIICKDVRCVPSRDKYEICLPTSKKATLLSLLKTWPSNLRAFVFQTNAKYPINRTIGEKVI